MTRGHRESRGSGRPRHLAAPKCLVDILSGYFPNVSEGTALQLRSKGPQRSVRCCPCLQELSTPGSGPAWGHCFLLLPPKSVSPSSAGALHSATLTLTQFLLVTVKVESWNVTPLLELYSTMTTLRTEKRGGDHQTRQTQFLYLAITVMNSSPHCNDFRHRALESPERMMAWVKRAHP